mmetsp:Transcript_13495/g.39840  ORF Transcript_13495/g.39840 Transcript_13495/m.39840 type:complete len:246 (+) Transcript_13495:2154-2891(+)
MISEVPAEWPIGPPPSSYAGAAHDGGPPRGCSPLNRGGGQGAACTEEVIVAEKRVRAGLAPAEELEDVGGGVAAAHAQHRLRVAAPEAPHLRLVVEARLLEGREAVRAEYLGVLVAVVARRVAAREDVGEATEEAVLRQGGDHRRAQGHGHVRLPHRRRRAGRSRRRRRLLVEGEVGESELELAQHVGGGAVVLGGADLAHQLRGDGLPRGVVPRHALERGGLLHPVLEPLRGLLHRVPLHAADA